MMLDRRVSFTLLALTLLVLSWFGRTRAQESPGFKRGQVPAKRPARAPIVSGSSSSKQTASRPAAPKSGKLNLRPEDAIAGKAALSPPNAVVKRNAAPPAPQPTPRQVENAVVEVRPAPQPDVPESKTIPESSDDRAISDQEQRNLVTADFHEAPPVRKKELEPMPEITLPRKPAAVVKLPEFFKGAPIPTAVDDPPAQVKSRAEILANSETPHELPVITPQKLPRQIPPFVSAPAMIDGQSNSSAPRDVEPIAPAQRPESAELIKVTQATEEPAATQPSAPKIAPPEPTPQPNANGTVVPETENKLAGLRSIRQIDVRAAVAVLPVVGTDSPQILQPHDQANEVLSKRPLVTFAAGQWTPTQTDRNTYPFHNYPLYFEHPNLERCGRGWGLLTTPVSMALFYSTIPTLPYRMTAQRPTHCVPALPDCRLCECFRWSVYLPPWDWKAAAAQAGATTGFIYFVP